MLFDWLVVENFEKYRRETVEISEKLLQMQDFYLEIKWEFDSFIPFLSKFAPTGSLYIFLEFFPKTDYFNIKIYYFR